MLEIEIKFSVADFGKLQAQLAEWGATVGVRQKEMDQYYQAPDRNFARTDEAFRLRCIDGQAYLTYKGPRIDAQTKTRTEIEVPILSEPKVVEQLGELFRHLGYRPALCVRKQRQFWHLSRGGFDLQVCLDEVEGLGRFVELEICAPAEDLETARTVLLDTATELGLTNPERRSYLELLLAQREGQG